MIKLGFHSHFPMFNDANLIYTQGQIGVFIDKLASHCEMLVCFAHLPRPDEVGIMDYKIRSQNLIFANMGPHSSVWVRTLFSRRYTRSFLIWQSKLDVLMIRGPSPLLPEMVTSAGNLPTVLLLVGDYVTSIQDLKQPFWRKEIIRLWIYWNKWKQNLAVKKSLTFVNSHKLFLEYWAKTPNLIEVKTSTLDDSDFYERADTCQTYPYHLLYIGRLSESKGLFFMIEAMYQLWINEHIETVLDLVGWPEKGEHDIVNRIRYLARTKGIEDRIIFHGYKPLGPELFKHYRNADIFVLASPFSEGFPRTIWEAMANSLPVVATRVGSIPDFIEGAAELVNPGDSADLSRAISNLINNPDLRKNYIQQGYRLAQSNTLDIQAKKMITSIEQWIDKKR